jgi:transcriptional regulator with XRE-family HTH domain
MAEFKRTKVEMFLGVTRKYMQVRGAMSQKELAEQTDVGISTMSRFLSQKSTELNPQLIAKITAKLNIPLHEMIDFVEEDFADRFIRLVKFYKDELNEEGINPEEIADSAPDAATQKNVNATATNTERRLSAEERREEAREIVKEEKTSSKDRSDKSIREKLESLTPRQRAFMTEFLNLKLEERDLIVDVGNNMFQYFKMKGMDI